jgi:hypothetical protein
MQSSSGPKHVFLRYKSCKHPVMLRSTLRAAAAVPGFNERTCFLHHHTCPKCLDLHYKLLPYIACGQPTMSHISLILNPVRGACMRSSTFSLVFTDIVTSSGASPTNLPRSLYSVPQSAG